ncbi:MAG: ATP-binding protein [Pseudomonadota bacterium]|nr:ATP-binding protein [Pseudomonadota bacterium]
MGASQTIPFAGIVLAVLTFLALLVLGVDPIIALAVLAVWIGSLLVAALRPPEKPSIIVQEPLERDMMRKLIENASTPFMITERNAIAIANGAARRMLGQHIVGQDARVAFRHPEAIQMLNSDKSGQVIVKGLVRRQDIWQFSRHAVDDELAIIELVNQTAEADISRAHTDFVANASHELRTPLAAILGYVETLADSSDSLDSPIAQKFLGTIEREAQRLQSLISDLMSLSRVEAEKHDLPTDLLDLKKLTERAARDAAGSNRIERLNLDLRLSAQIRGDGQQLEQLIRNLVDNALKYGSDGSTVTVELVRGRDDQARISVIDQGEGIAPEQIPHLTRRFYRTDPGRSRASGGTGLGLAIVKHIAERHRGRLDIESELGKGTTVTVRFPIVEESDKAASGQEQEKTSLAHAAEAGGDIAHNAEQGLS